MFLIFADALPFPVVAAFLEDMCVLCANLLYFAIESHCLLFRVMHGEPVTGLLITCCLAHLVMNTSVKVIRSKVMS